MTKVGQRSVWNMLPWNCLAPPPPPPTHTHTQTHTHAHIINPDCRRWILTRSTIRSIELAFISHAVSSICSFLAVLTKSQLLSSSVCLCCFSCVPEFPTNLSELSSKVSELPSKLAAGVGEVTQKCVLQ